MKIVRKLNSGFTLVELMVVVAIIGILSAVAVPNFRKYQAKSKRSEANINLAQIYTAEQGALADYSTFGTCLDVLGVDFGGAAVTTRYYTVGFGATYAGNPAIAGCSTGVLSYSGGKGGATAALPTTAVATQTVFDAAAWGYVSGKIAATTDIDKISIDEQKVVTVSNTGF